MYGWFIFHKITRMWLCVHDPQAEMVDVVPTPAQATRFDTREQARDVLAYFTGNPSFPECEVVDATIPDAPTPDANPTSVRSQADILAASREASEARAALAREQRFHRGGEAVLIPRYGTGNFTIRGRSY